MKVFPFKKIDAFAVAASLGNPAGAIYLDSFEDITEGEMQQIAKELKGFVNEVGYLFPLEAAHFGLRYYSSEREVDFCGHATVAIMYDLLKNNESLLAEDIVYITTNKGCLPVINRIKEQNAVFISAPQPVFSARYPEQQRIAQALRIPPQYIAENYPITIVNAGLETLIVPINGLQNTITINPDLAELKDFCLSNSIDIITVFTSETYNHSCHYRTRVFAPTFGYLEDPATGSGNSAFGYYLARLGIWTDSFLSIEQSKFLASANLVKLEQNRNEKDQVQVSFGGNGVVRIIGEYQLI